MAEAFISEIRMFAFGIVPRGWALCNGQTLGIQQNQALFALIGTTYGGNGQTTFQLPNLQGLAPLSMGNSPAGGSYTLGQRAGETNVTVNISQLPAHSHIVQANGSANAPGGSSTAVPGGGGVAGYGTPPNTAMSSSIISNAGGSQPHSNMQPYQVINFCMCVIGIFPSRN